MGRSEGRVENRQLVRNQQRGRRLIEQLVRQRLLVQPLVAIAFEGLRCVAQAASPYFSTFFSIAVACQGRNHASRVKVTTSLLLGSAPFTRNSTVATAGKGKSGIAPP